MIGKFSYGWRDIQDLIKFIPTQCELKGQCNIGLLSNIHVFIRETLLEDYVHLLSNPTFTSHRITVFSNENAEMGSSGQS